MSTSVRVVGTTPVKVAIPMTAVFVGDSGLQFEVTTESVPGDGLQEGFPVRPTQDAVQVATSMAIRANEQGLPWTEGVEIPAHVPGSGTLEMTAGVGHYPAVLDAASLVYKDDDIKTDRDADTWISRMVLEAMVDAYGGFDDVVEGSTPERIMELSDQTHTALRALTDNELGMRWSDHWYPRQNPDVGLNTFALYSDLRAGMETDSDLIKQYPYTGLHDGTTNTEKPTWEPEPKDDKYDAYIADGYPMAVPMPMPMPMPTVRPRTPAPMLQGRRLMQMTPGNDFPVPPMLAQYDEPIIMDGYWGGGAGDWDMYVPVPIDVDFYDYEIPEPIWEVPEPVPEPKGRLTPVDSTLRETWAKALSRGMSINYYNSIRCLNCEFRNWDSLASTLLVLGLDWVAQPVEYEYAKGDPGAVLNKDLLLQHFNDLSYIGQANLALAYLLRSHEVSNSDEWVEIVDEVVQRMLSGMRLQGRTAYLTMAPGNPSAAPMDHQAMALSVLSLYDSGHPFTEKLAAYVAEGSKAIGGRYYWNSKSKALSTIALLDYDSLRGSQDPNLDFTAKAAKSVLMQTTFESPSDPVEHTVVPFVDIPMVRSQNGVSPANVEFIAKGVGEASVAMVLDFVPLTMSPDPTYRGIYVERLVQKLDNESGDGVGVHTQVATSGEFYKITIQITTPDDLVGVFLEDLLAGGFEALDPNLDNAPAVSGSNSNINFRSSCWFCWRNTFGAQETEKDRITWYANRLDAGTHSVSYTVVANTPGAFLHPPARAYVSSQPELMGLSGGNYMVVTSEQVAKSPEEEVKLLTEYGIPVSTVEYPKECLVACDDMSSCNVRTGQCQRVDEIRVAAPESYKSKMAKVVIDDFTSGLQDVVTKGKGKGKGKSGKGRKGGKNKTDADSN